PHTPLPGGSRAPTTSSPPPAPAGSARARPRAGARPPARSTAPPRRRYAPTFLARLGPLQNVLFLSEPAYVKAVLTGDTDLLRTGDINGVFRPIIGSHSILLLDGPPHMEERKLLLPPFHGRSLQGFRAVIQEAAAREVASWPVGKRFAALPRMHAVSTEIVLGAILGIRDQGRLDALRVLLPRFLDLSQSSAVFIPALRGVSRSWRRLMRCIAQ